MPPSKFTSAEEQRKAEKKRFEKKQKPKPVLADKLKMKREKEGNKQGERFNSGDY